MLLLAVLVNLYVKNSRARGGDAIMTDTIREHADHTLHKGEPLVEMNDVGKAYGADPRPARAST